MTDMATIAPTPARRDCVLVVDDEPLIRWSVAETLRQCGYTIFEAGDAEAARSAASDSRSPFGVAVLDVRLPDSDGLGLLTELRRIVPGVRIILMTAHGCAELARQALDLGAYSVLNKPFGLADVAALVDQARLDHDISAGPADEHSQAAAKE